MNTLRCAFLTTYASHRMDVPMKFLLAANRCHHRACLVKSFRPVFDFVRPFHNLSVLHASKAVRQSIGGQPRHNWFDSLKMRFKNRSAAQTAATEELPPDLKAALSDAPIPGRDSTIPPAQVAVLREANNLGREDMHREYHYKFFRHPIVLYTNGFFRILSSAILFYFVYKLYKHITGALKSVSEPMKSKTRLFPFASQKTFDVVENMTIRFSDVRGNHEAKKELHQMVDFLKNPQRYTQVGARLPKGVLLAGPPGVGKTLMAKAVAGEAGVPFISACGSEFDEVFVGVGSSRIRTLFQKARGLAPCVVFIDEMDALGHKRSHTTSNPYANQTVDQLLSELDGFTPSEGVIVLAATNRPDHLDKALLRPGRFDTTINLLNPFFEERVELFQYFLGKVKCEPDVDASELAGITVGYNGASISNMVNQAALLAAMDRRTRVSKDDCLEAMKKVQMGPARRIRLSKDSLLATAYHEAGHALNVLSSNESFSLKLGMVTILPRGSTLGHNSFKVKKDIHNITKEDAKSQLRCMLGGRAAEELVYGPKLVTTGAHSDFKQATDLAEQMVKEWGMSDKTTYPFLGSKSGQISDKELEIVDNEIKEILDEAYAESMRVLVDKEDQLHRLANALLQYESLNEDDVRTVLNGGKPRAPCTNIVEFLEPHA